MLYKTAFRVGASETNSPAAQWLAVAALYTVSPCAFGILLLLPVLRYTRNQKSSSDFLPGLNRVMEKATAAVGTEDDDAVKPPYAADGVVYQAQEREGTLTKIQPRRKFPTCGIC